ncbi:hypothetical protein HK096_003127, partial [Nowakowskiella sp. JEL0078]
MRMVDLDASSFEASALVQACLYDKKYRLVIQAIDSHSAKSLPITQQMWICAILAYIRLNNPLKAADVLLHTVSRKVSVSSLAWTLTVRALIINGHWQLGDQILTASFTYNPSRPKISRSGIALLLKDLLRAQLSTKVYREFETIINQNMDVLGSRGLSDLLLSFANHANETGVIADIDILFLNRVLKIGYVVRRVSLLRILLEYSRLGAIDKAQFVLGLMKEKEFEITNSAYHEFMEACLKFGNIDMVLEAYDLLLKKRQVRPGAFWIVGRALSVKGDYKKIHELIENAILFGFEKDIRINHLKSICSLNLQLDRLTRDFEERKIDVSYAPKRNDEVSNKVVVNSDLKRNVETLISELRNIKQQGQSQLLENNVFSKLEMSSSIKSDLNPSVVSDFERTEIKPVKYEEKHNLGLLRNDHLNKSLSEIREENFRKILELYSIFRKFNSYPTPPLLVKIYRVCILSGDFKKALEILKDIDVFATAMKYQITIPDNNLCSLHLSKILDNYEDAQTCQVLLQSLKIAINNDQLIKLVQMHIAHNNYELAENLVLTTLDISPNHLSAHVFHILIHHAPTLETANRWHQIYIDKFPDKSNRHIATSIIRANVKNYPMVLKHYVRFVKDGFVADIHIHNILIEAAARGAPQALQTHLLILRIAGLPVSPITILKLLVHAPPKKETIEAFSRDPPKWLNKYHFATLLRNTPVHLPLSAMSAMIMCGLPPCGAMHIQDTASGGRQNSQEPLSTSVSPDTSVPLSTSVSPDTSVPLLTSVSPDTSGLSDSEDYETVITHPSTTNSTKQVAIRLFFDACREFNRTKLASLVINSAWTRRRRVVQVPADLWSADGYWDPETWMAAIRAVRTNPALVKWVWKIMQNRIPDASDRVTVAVLDVLVDVLPASEAFSMFEKFGGLASESRKTWVWIAVLRRAAKEKDWERLDNLLSEGHSKGVVNKSVFVHVAREVASNTVKKWNVTRIIDWAIKHDIELDITVYNALLDVYAKTCSLLSAAVILDLIHDAKIHLNTVSWTILMDLFIRASNPRAALSIWQAIWESQIEHHLKLSNVMLNPHLKLVNENASPMPLTLEITAVRHAHNTASSVLAILGLQSQVCRRLAPQLVKSTSPPSSIESITPPPAAVALALDAAGRNNDPVHALNLWKQLCDGWFGEPKGLVNENHLCSLVEALCRCGWVARAVEEVRGVWWEDGKVGGWIVPDEKTLEVLEKAVVNDGEMKEEVKKWRLQLEKWE